MKKKDKNDQTVIDVGENPVSSDTGDEATALVSQEMTVKRRGRKRTEYDETLFDKTIVFIKEKINETVFRGSVEIGEYIFKEFYDGDRNLVSSKNPKKEASLRKLAERPDCPLTYSAISNMLRVAVQEWFLKEGSVDVDKLHYTHKIKLLSLKDTETKIDIAKSIIEKSLSTREAMKLIAEQKSKEHTEIGERQSRIPKTVKILRFLVDDPQFSRFDFEVDSILNLDEEKRTELKNKMNEVLQEIKILSKECRNTLAEIEKIEKQPPTVIEL